MSGVILTTLQQTVIELNGKQTIIERRANPQLVLDRGASISPSTDGWVWLRDDVYDESSPLELVTDTRTQVTLNPGSASEEDYAPDGAAAAWWANDAFQSQEIGDTYDARLTFYTKPELIGRSIEWEFDISGLGVVGGGHLDLAQDAGTARRLQLIIPYFTLATFASGGARIYFTADGDVDIWGQGLFIRRTRGSS